MALASLSASEKRFYADNGYLLLGNALSDTWLERFRHAVLEVLETHKELTSSTPRVSLHANHSRTAPVLERVANPDLDSETIRSFASKPEVLELVTELLGEKIRFRHSSIVFYRPGTRSYDWHQDAAYFPQGTRVLMCIRLADCGSLDARNVVVPGSHKGPLLSHIDQHGAFTGLISRDEFQKVNLASKVELVGPAKALEFLHPMTVHQDGVGCQRESGPVLRFTYTSDA